MIPATITREHILQALRDIDGHGVPPGRGATKYALEHDGRLYPPKLVVSIAARHALGSELDPAIFSGGQETNHFLGQRGFRIAETRSETRRDPNEPLTPAVLPERRAPHTRERCPACKVRVRELLEALFGRVEERYSLGLGALPGNYDGTPHRDALEAIHARLASPPQGLRSLRPDAATATMRLFRPKARIHRRVRRIPTLQVTPEHCPAVVPEYASNRVRPRPLAVALPANRSLRPRPTVPGRTAGLVRHPTRLRTCLPRATADGAPVRGPNRLVQTRSSTGDRP